MSGVFGLAKKGLGIIKKMQDEKRATIREDARKPKNVSKPKAITTKKPTMRDVTGPKKRSDKHVRDKLKRLSKIKRI